MPTAASICVAIADAIEAIAPDRLSGDRFREARNEGNGAFIEWAETNPTGVWRRFQVHELGVELDPSVSNTTEEWRVGLFEISIAYPLSHRAGDLGAVDRDALIESDLRQLEAAIGQTGTAVLNAAGATWIKDGYQVSRLPGEACDFLVIHQRLGFWRSFA